ncbi:MAG: PilN domain-containing protein [Candidatus Moraniibacteriota bacterium]
MIEEERPIQRSFFDVGVLLSLTILILVGLGWGGLRFYMNSLDKKIAEADTALNANMENTRGERVDRVADFEARVKYFTKNRDGFVEPKDILSTLEGTMVSGIVLTQYEYDSMTGVSTLSGRAEDFKKLAEQMLSLKSEKIFSQVQVDKTDRDEENRITFILKASQ